MRVLANTNLWTPVDFGQARMAALGWLYAASLKEGDPDAWAKGRQLDAERPGADPRLLWDLYYLQIVRALPREIFAATVRLARTLPGDPAAQYVFLTALSGRATDSNVIVRVAIAAAGTAADKVPPLPPRRADAGPRIVRRPPQAPARPHHGARCSARSPPS